MRQQNRQKNSEVLIQATLNSIVDIGFARTSVTEIVQRAKLSRGMVHLHFKGKEELLEAAAQHAYEMYNSNLRQRLSQADSAPQAQLAAVIYSDLSEEVLDWRSVKIWYAFRGEAPESIGIAKFSDTRDEVLRDILYTAFLALCKESNMPVPDRVAKDTMHGTLALLEGMWTDFLLHPQSFNRETAQRIVFRFLAAIFPSHFDLSGPIFLDSLPR